LNGQAFALSGNPQFALSIRTRIGALTACCLLATVFTAPDAAAYCRAKACDALYADCLNQDENGCYTDGAPMWGPAEVTFWIDAEGSPAEGITAEEVQAAMEEAASAWTDIVCDNGAPPVLEIVIGGIRDDVEPGYSFDRSVAAYNLVHFVDEGWTDSERRTANTIRAMHGPSGEILDADIGINSELFDFAIAPNEGRVHLTGILVHEVGHALGLDHSNIEDATMVASAEIGDRDDLVSLSDDDKAGLCAIYEEGASRDPGPTAAPDRFAGPPPDGSDGICAVRDPRGSAKPSASVLGVLLCLSLAALARRRE
jgi:hypothetical protein